MSLCLSSESSITSDGGYSYSNYSNYSSRKEVEKYTAKESESVKTWREMVTGILVITATVVTFATFIILGNEQSNNFRYAFTQFVDSVTKESTVNAKVIQKTCATISKLITSETLRSGDVWPLVTIPSFELLGDEAREVTTADVVSFSPLVAETGREDWEAYAFKENQSWLKESFSRSKEDTHHESDDDYLVALQSGIPHHVYTERLGAMADVVGPGPFAPIWQISPPPRNTSIVNFDLLSTPETNQLYHAMMETRGLVLSRIVYPYPFRMEDATSAAKPYTKMLYPIFQDFSNDSAIVGFLQILLPWEDYLSSLLSGWEDVLLVVENTCGDVYSFSSRVNGTEILGRGDMHDASFDEQGGVIELLMLGSDANTTIKKPNVTGYCSYNVHVFPSRKLRSNYRTGIPVFFTMAVGLTFLITSAVFLNYDRFVVKRFEKLVMNATKTNAIVSSLYPSTIRDRLFADDAASNATTRTPKCYEEAPGLHLKKYLQDGFEIDFGKPIADLFPDTTVFFADLVGFTAWSSVREPSQVFTLLETLFSVFDDLANNRRVFKVETVGDCYVAVTGLPQPRKDHAVAMAKFAVECLFEMQMITERLELSLGPGTADLSLRLGLHSGPVTAGVLRGEKSRFQLFGDTMNTASRMESTGQRGRIQVSQETADLLTAAGKGSWLHQREDKVVAKGKGELTTYWLSLGTQSSSTESATEPTKKLTAEFGPECVGDSMRGSSGILLDEWVDNEPTEIRKRSSTKESNSERRRSVMSSSRRSSSWQSTNSRMSMRSLLSNKQLYAMKTNRLVEWNVELLRRILKKIAVRRQAVSSKKGWVVQQPTTNYNFRKEGQIVLDEVREIIMLPKFDGEVAKEQEAPESIELSVQVTTQLHNYIQTIASMYHENSFHNFEHASHVTMSVVKLLSRIVAPAGINYDDAQCTSEKSARAFQKEILSQMHDHTYGITSDPLTQFAVVLSAIIHDVDHVGVPNSTLMNEKFPIAEQYRNKSIAEQNSVDLSWNLLMTDRYKDLRAAIYCTEDEFQRFRQLVVNTVLATDIVDKELKDLRNARWDKAFKECPEETLEVATNRKATIVIEHLIQASDVAHTMQHWHIYRNWNERLFKELYKAYKDGRSDTDPSEFWYKGEIGFFDFYIIPLAKKLRDCGAFGVSCDEYLNYAMQNRAEWERKGTEIVSEMVSSVRSNMQVVDSQEDVKNR